MKYFNNIEVSELNDAKSQYEFYVEVLDKVNEVVDTVNSLDYDIAELEQIVLTKGTPYTLVINRISDTEIEFGYTNEQGLPNPDPVRLTIPVGAQGIQGERGEKGDRGEQGIQGIQGERGLQGERGVQGERGERGEQGIQGVPGARGFTGEKGEQGIQGVQGNTGLTGAQGIRGLQGVPGVMGLQGEEGTFKVDDISTQQGNALSIDSSGKLFSPAMTVVENTNLSYDLLITDVVPTQGQMVITGSGNALDQPRTMKIHNTDKLSKTRTLSLIKVNDVLTIIQGSNTYSYVVHTLPVVSGSYVSFTVYRIDAKTPTTLTAGACTLYGAFNFGHENYIAKTGGQVNDILYYDPTLVVEEDRALISKGYVDDVAKATLVSKIYPNVGQIGTPTPDVPIPLEPMSGDTITATAVGYNLLTPDVAEVVTNKSGTTNNYYIGMVCTDARALLSKFSQTLRFDLFISFDFTANKAIPDTYALITYSGSGNNPMTFGPETSNFQSYPVANQTIRYVRRVAEKELRTLGDGSLTNPQISVAIIRKGLLVVSPDSTVKDITFSITNIKLTLNYNDTPEYQRQELSTQSITVNEPLRACPTVADEIYFNNDGKLVVKRVIEEIYVDGVNKYLLDNNPNTTHATVRSGNIQPFASIDYNHIDGLSTIVGASSNTITPDTMQKAYRIQKTPNWYILSHERLGSSPTETGETLHAKWKAWNQANPFYHWAVKVIPTYEYYDIEPLVLFPGYEKQYYFEGITNGTIETSEVSLPQVMPTIKSHETRLDTLEVEAQEQAYFDNLIGNPQVLGHTEKDLSHYILALEKRIRLLENPTAQKPLADQVGWVDMYSGSFVRVMTTTIPTGQTRVLDMTLRTNNPPTGGAIITNINTIGDDAAIWFDNGGNLGKMKMANGDDVLGRTLKTWITNDSRQTCRQEVASDGRPQLTVVSVVN